MNLKHILPALKAVAGHGTGTYDHLPAPAQMAAVFLAMERYKEATA